RRRKPRTARPCCTPTSAAPATTIKETNVAHSSHARPVARPRTARNGQKLLRYGRQPGERRTRSRGVAGHSARAREHTASAEAFREPRQDRQAAPPGGD